MKSVSDNQDNEGDHVFISYARIDGIPYANELELTLTEKGYKVWRDTRSINPSQDFTGIIEAGIKHAFSRRCIGNRG